MCFYLWEQRTASDYKHLCDFYLIQMSSGIVSINDIHDGTAEDKDEILEELQRCQVGYPFFTKLYLR